MNEQLIEIQIHEPLSFLPEEQIITWSRILEDCIAKYIIASLILAIVFLLAVIIWLGVEHLL